MANNKNNRRTTKSRGSSKRKNRKKNKFKRILRKIFLVVGILFLIFMVVGSIVFIYNYNKYTKYAEKVVKAGGKQAFKENLTSIIYDADGNVITELIGSHDTYYVDSDDIPYFVKSAFITTEDRNFYKHSGVDLKAVARAFYELLRNKGEITQGGSTITQQLARNIFLSHEVTWDRKVKEMFIAREIEKEYSKDEILEFYVNNIYFGNGFYGIEAASRGYFSKSVTELSLAEIAYICSIPNNPTLYDPFTNSDATLSRKNRILKQMYEQQDIDMEMYNEALYSTIVLCPTKNETSNYVETYIRFCATESLMQNVGFELQYKFDSDDERNLYNKRYNELYKEMSNKLYTGGYKIYTSIDMEMQRELQEAIDENLEYYQDTGDDGVFSFQGAATCIDNANGKVVAIVGGRSQEYNGFTLNRAYQSFRQPGSCIKPLIDYLPAFERGLYPESIMSDEEIEGGPVNSPNVYEGDISLRYAVAKSKNTIAWELFDEIGIRTCMAYIENMNFDRITADDYVPAASIGGLTYGVSTLEMASAYSTIENEGIFRSPTCIQKITDIDDNIIIDNYDYENSKTTTVITKQIYDVQATRMMSDVLKDVLITGTGKNYNIPDAICAGKTGTTNSNKDVWFVGYSKYYTTAVWCGYDMPKEINDGVGTKCSGNTWQQFMSSINSGLNIVDFPPYVKKDGNMSNGEEENYEEESEEESEETEELYTEQDSTKEQQSTNNTETTKAIEEENTSGNLIDENNQSTEENSSDTENTEDSQNQVETDGEDYSGGGYVPDYNVEPTAPGGASGNGIYQEYWG